MNYTELIKDMSLEQVIAINKFTDYLLECTHRATKMHLKGLRVAGEVVEAEKFRAMMPEPQDEEQTDEEEPVITDEDIEDIILYVEGLENIKISGCAYPDVLLSKTFPLKKE